MSSLQKKLAAKVLKVGKSKVWINPEKREDVEAAITKADIRRLIQKGIIKALKLKIHKHREKSKRRRKAGSRKGSKYATVSSKRRWIQSVRPLRRMLKELRDKGELDKKTYRQLYLLVKGGMFRSRSHLRIYLQQRDLLKKPEKKSE